MTDKISRPISIWITQILLMLFIVLFSVGFFLILNIGLTILSSPNKMAITGILLVSVFYLLILAGLVVAFWGLIKRKSYGRWISVALLCLFFVFSLLSKFSSSKGVPFEYYEYGNTTELIAGAITQIILYGLLLSLIISLIKSKTVSIFFDTRQPQKSEENI